jgi:tight adherence protein B
VWTASVAAAAVVTSGILAAVTIGAVERDRVRRRLGAPTRARKAAVSRRWVSAAGVVIVAAAGWWVGHVGGLVAALIGAAAAPRILVRRREARRLGAIDDQLSDAVASISAGLRAGMSVLTAIGRAADDVGEPLAGFLRDIVGRCSLGMPIDGSLARFSSDVPTPGARLVVTALTLHHRVGGDGPTVLDRLAETLRQRAEGEREIGSLTAQARLSGTILGVLPVAFFLFLLVTSREDVTAAYRSPAGATAILAGSVMQATAFLWIRRLLRVEA